MFCWPVDTVEISKLIRNLQHSKSPGYDNITASLIKEVSEGIIQPLVYIYNLSMETGIFPDNLKIAKVIPAYKKGDACMASNYRPISLLSIFDKLFEKVMYKRLYSHLECHKVLYNYQSGFRKNHGTNLALIEVIDSIYKSLDSGKIVCGVFLDLQKAFDTVQHDILLNKLFNYGIRGVVQKWFYSYLYQRRQYTVIGKVNSSMAFVSCGIPQGSVLGPLLFLIYINDIKNACCDTSIKLFADDANFFAEGDNESELAIKVNRILDNISLWCAANKLSLSPAKTCYSIFGNCSSNIKLLLNGKEIGKTESVKYLGLLIDDKLKWINHIDNVYNKIIKYVGIFYKIRNKLPYAIFKQLYFAFVHSHISYAIEIYLNTCDSYFDKLTILNNKILRILLLLYSLLLMFAGQAGNQ